MDWTLATHLLYLLVTLPLTFLVARSLARHGTAFLADAFEHREGLARSVNHLLLLGFGLVNTGFVLLLLRAGGPVRDATGAVEVLSVKLGVVLLVLGLLHLANVAALGGTRRRRVELAEREAAVASVASPPGSP